HGDRAQRHAEPPGGGDEAGGAVGGVGVPGDRDRHLTPSPAAAWSRMAPATSAPVTSVIPAKPAHASTSSTRTVPSASSTMSTPPKSSRHARSAATAIAPAGWPAGSGDP